MSDKKTPPYVGAERAYQAKQRGNYTRKKYAREFDRSQLTTPASYYRSQFQNLKIKAEWVKVLCCFHDDNTPSLSINMVNGHFKCFSCGIKGGDVLAFHMLRYKLSFPDAVTYFGAWRHE